MTLLEAQAAAAAQKQPLVPYTTHLMHDAPGYRALDSVSRNVIILDVNLSWCWGRGWGGGQCQVLGASKREAETEELRR